MGGENAGGDCKRSREQGFRLVYIRSSHVQDDQKRQLQRKPLTNACAEANGVAYEYSLFDKAYSGMGTTVGGVIKYSGNGYIINVGDSRAYHISRKK